MVQLMVLVSLFTSAVAVGYSRERPVAAPSQSGRSNTEVPPQSSEKGPTSSPPPGVSSTSPADIPSLLGTAYYPGLSSDYLSRYAGPIAVPTVLPDGHIADTAAVAAARAAHLAVLEKAKALWYGPRDDGLYDPYKYGDYAYNNKLLANSLSGQLGVLNQNLFPTYLQNLGNRPYYGPMDTSLGIPKGYVAEAKAIEMAKEAQLKALEKARTEAFVNGNLFPYASLYPTYRQSILNGSNINPLATLLGLPYSGVQGPLNIPYFGPLATPTSLSSGYLADTPEVAAARAAHLSALLRAKELWDAKGAGDALRYGGYGQQFYNNYLQNYPNGPFTDPSGILRVSPNSQGLFNTPYNGPLATPTVLPSGYLADTPAIAVARAAHLSALARARAEAALWRSHHLYKKSD